MLLKSFRRSKAPEKSIQLSKRSPPSVVMTKFYIMIVTSGCDDTALIFILSMYFSICRKLIVKEEILKHVLTKIQIFYFCYVLSK